MKMPTLNTRDARALQLGAMILIPVALYLGVLAPAFRAITRDRATLAQEERALTSDSALIARSRTIGADQARTTAWLAHEARRLFTGATDITATSALSDYISTTASTAGLQLQQSETRPSVPAGGALRAVHVNIHGQGTALALLTFLQALENGNRLVRLDQVLIGPGSEAGIQQPQFRRRNGWGNRDGGGGGGGGGEGGAAQPEMAPAPVPVPDAKSRPLSITADVYGYTLLPPPAGIRVLTAELGTAYEPLTGNGISLLTLADAITHNPFSRDRDATVRAPIIAAPPVATTGRGPKAFPVQLLGTVVNDNGGTFAMCSITGGTPRMVHIGDQVAGYTVRGIERGRMSLASITGQLVHLTLSTSGA